MDKYLNHLLRPHWQPLLAAIVCLILGLSSGGMYFKHLTLKSLSLPQQYVDDSSYISHIATRFTPQNKLTIILLGGSVTREATLQDDVIEKLWQEKYSEDIDFINIGSSNQSLFESLALLTTMGIPKNSIIVQQFSYKKINTNLDALKSEYLTPRTTYLDYSLLEPMLSFSDIIQRKLTPDLLLFAGPIRNYLAKRGCGYISLVSHEGRSRCYKDKIIKRFHYSGIKPMSKLEKTKYLREMQREVIPNYKRNYKLSIETLSKISNLVHSNGGKLVLAIYPFDQLEKEINDIITSSDLYNKVYSESNRLGKILHYGNSSDFSHDDFYDTQHLTLSGKNKFSDIFINKTHRFSKGGIQ